MPSAYGVLGAVAVTRVAVGWGAVGRAVAVGLAVGVGAPARALADAPATTGASVPVVGNAPRIPPELDSQPARPTISSADTAIR
jgi:hypothetical protein